MVKLLVFTLLGVSLFLLPSCAQAPKKKKPIPGMSETSQLPWNRPESWQGGGSRFGLPQYN